MTPRRRLAFLGDIHGNLPALAAAAAHMQALSPDAVYLLGDLVNRCPWNNEVMEMVSDKGWPSVRGNHDLIISRLHTPAVRPPFDDRSHFPIMYWTWDHLDSKHIASLHELPAEQTIAVDGAPSIRLLHGLPGNPFVGVAPETEADDIARDFAVYSEPLIIGGHTHRPLDRQIGDKRFLNGGSIGLPYNGDPRAQYLVLDLYTGADGPCWQPSFQRVEYDRTLVSAAFRSTGMLDEAGPLAQLYLRTVLNGEPWASDFGYWLKSQPQTVRGDMAAAVDRYLSSHGPGHWAFLASH